jgi:hypothetical protein
MLDIFASVGATCFELTIKGLDGKLKSLNALKQLLAGDPNDEDSGFRPAVPLPELRRAMPTILRQAINKQFSVIVRPEGPQTTFVQLDDLDHDKLTKASPPCFFPWKRRGKIFRCGLRSAEGKILTSSDA